MPRGKHDNHVRGADHPRWNDGRMVSTHGYVKIRVGPDHPLADPNGYAYEHLIVLAAADVEVPDGHVVHHLNGDKTDNRLANLKVLSRGDHNSEHLSRRDRDEHGRFLRTTDVEPPETADA